MYTFLAWFQRGPCPETSHSLLCAKSFLENLFDRFGSAYDTRAIEYPEVNGGMLSLVPKASSSLLSTFNCREFYIIAFGELINQAGNNLAEVLAKELIRAGLDSARGLDGCYSAVIIDKNNHTVFVISDLIGRRSFRYYYDKNRFLVSSHDIPLLATDIFNPSLNYLAISSIAKYGWSLKGMPICAEIVSCDPNHVVSWSNGKVERSWRPIILPDSRIDKKDSSGILVNLDSMIEVMRQNLSSRCSSASEINIDLTAGLDTRTVLALLQSLGLRIPVKAQTSGQENSVDVRTARLLSKYYRISYNHMTHQNDCDTKRSIDSILNHSKVLAFMMNGDTSSKRTTSILTQAQNSFELRLMGSGGELYRGYYYPSARDIRSIASISSRKISAYLQRKLAQHSHLPWKEGHEPSGLSSLMDSVFEEYGKMSSFIYDWLDMFYQFERYGRWASMVSRTFQTTDCHSPFDSIRLLRLAYNMPAPISQNAILQKTIIKRYLKPFYYLPINEDSILPMINDTIYGRTLQKISTKFTNAIGTRVRKYIYPRHCIHDIDSERSRTFFGPMKQTISELLLESNSISNTIFERQKLSNLIEKKTEPQITDLNLIGSLLTVEQWRTLVDDTRSHIHNWKYSRGNSTNPDQLFRIN